MLWPRHTCPFGLPDDAEETENIVLLAIGYSLREGAKGVTDAPLPARFVALLHKLEMRERALRMGEHIARRQQVRRRPHDRPLAEVRARTPAAEPAVTSAASA